MELPLQYAWSDWVPDTLFSAHTGRLSVECKGSLLNQIRLRQATQTEFEEVCVFSS